MATKLYQVIRKAQGSTTTAAVKITRLRTCIYQGRGNRNIRGNRIP